jgi:hypothetical protein
LILKEKTRNFKMHISNCPRCGKKAYKNMGIKKENNNTVVPSAPINFPLPKSSNVAGLSRLIKLMLMVNKHYKH